MNEENVVNREALPKRQRELGEKIDYLKSLAGSEDEEAIQNMEEALTNYDYDGLGRELQAFQEDLKESIYVPLNTSG